MPFSLLSPLFWKAPFPQPFLTLKLLMEPQNPTLDIQTLKDECPGVDFNAPFQFDTELTIGDYIVKYLPITWEIITNSLDIENESILDFVNAYFDDFRLPVSRIKLIRYLQCSKSFADKFMEAQESHFAISFEPKEHRILDKYEFMPFKVNSLEPSSMCYGGIIQQVKMGDQIFASIIWSGC
jgi:hypothetical protein